MKIYICDSCGKESKNGEDIPEYGMFGWDGNSGTPCMLCKDCETKIMDMITGKLKDKN